MSGELAVIGTEGRLLIVQGLCGVIFILGFCAWLQKSWLLLIAGIVFLMGVLHYLSAIKCLRCGFPVWRVMIFRNMLPAKCPECQASYE